MRYEDQVPLLVETSDNHPAFRREGTVSYVRRDGSSFNKSRMSFGMIKLFIGLIIIFLITISIILYTNLSISSRLNKLHDAPSTKSYQMVPHHRTTRQVHKKQTRKNDFLKRFTTKPATKKADKKPILEVVPTSTHRIVAARLNKTQIIKFKGDWQCGTAAISRGITRNLIENDCPHLLDAVNGCCIVHDRCYDEQLGQNLCDTGFCKCLNSVTLDTSVNTASKCHKEHSPWFCEMVKAFGDSYYENAGLNTTLHTGFVDIFGEEANITLPKRVRQKRV
ncbi:Protein F35C11.5 [Aphelenchoides bicaudatus]|nr:Protein F35C11.5 [Aphelenchoides bicaudatus]